MSAEQLKDFLRARGCPEPAVNAGLAGLVEDWERIAGEIERGYSVGLDDYLNDLDARELIAAAIAAVPKALSPALRRRLDAADRTARAALVPAGRCLWGPKLAALNRWDAESHWWYYMVPARPGDELKKDLEAR
jgi:hypothetical protein